MRNLLHCWISKSALLIGVSLAATVAAPAQATSVAQRGAEITPFVQTTLLNPDWGPTRNIGYMAGVDYTRFIRSIVQPSLEVRMTSASGTTVNERSFAGGLKLQTTVHGIYPYATLLAGTGDITFIHPAGTYVSDHSFIYSMGGGAEFNVRPQWKLRFDFAQQHWNLNPKTLTPTTLSVGVAYRIPFHNGAMQ